jgi:hypothetical protein
MENMIAYCGLVCTDCPAYKATQANDREALEQITEKWKEQFNMPDLTVDTVMCDGCLTTSGRLTSYCTQCAIRSCGIERDVVNCAHCDDYACENLRNFFQYAPEAEKRLDEIRSARA